MPLLFELCHVPFNWKQTNLFEWKNIKLVAWLCIHLDYIILLMHLWPMSALSLLCYEPISMPQLDLNTLPLQISNLRLLVNLLCTSHFIWPHRFSVRFCYELGNSKKKFFFVMKTNNCWFNLYNAKNKTLLYLQFSIRKIKVLGQNSLDLGTIYNLVNVEKTDLSKLTPGHDTVTIKLECSFSDVQYSFCSKCPWILVQIILF